jgi:hypothetical protein
VGGELNHPSPPLVRLIVRVPRLTVTGSFPDAWARIEYSPALRVLTKAPVIVYGHGTAEAYMIFPSRADISVFLKAITLEWYPFERKPTYPCRIALG